MVSLQIVCCLLVTVVALVAGNADIILSGSTITVSGTGVTVKGTVATITSAGTYVVKGTLYDGQLVVDSSKGTVEVVLSGASISSSTGCAFLVEQSSSTLVTLTSGTVNTFSDATVYANPDDDPNAAFFAKDEVTISGAGKLVVIGNYADGITSKDTLTISGTASISVEAVDDGIRGKDTLIVKDNPTISIVSGGDAVKSDDDQAGEILIQGGTFIIESQGDAFDAYSTATFTRGTFQVTAVGKAITAGIDIYISGGSFVMDSTDDSLHATNGSVVIDGGNLDLKTGDDAIHSGELFNINNGDVLIRSCYEGLESKILNITGGTVHLTSSDDGINGAIDEKEGNHLYISGGYVYVNALGDGIDINGGITMSDGTLIVSGPTRGDNGAVDYDTTFPMTGGIMIAAGSCGMANTASDSSTQYALLASLNSTVAAGTLFNLQTSTGANLLTVAPAKQYQTMAYASPSFKPGTYSIYYGGTCTGTPVDGVYNGGTYSGGTFYMSFTVTSIVTTVGPKCGGTPPPPHSGSFPPPHSGSFPPPPSGSPF